MLDIFGAELKHRLPTPLFQVCFEIDIFFCHSNQRSSARIPPLLALMVGQNFCFTGTTHVKLTNRCYCGSRHDTSYGEMLEQLAVDLL